MKLIKNTFLSIILLINLLYSTIVYVTESGNGTMNGTSWENALPGDSLQTAISNSQLGDEVWVAKGTYKPNSWPNVGSGDRQKHFAISNGLYGGFNGTETGISQRNIKNN
ncbi:MAG: hypothetical protein L6407_09555, partial [Candidatus Delongbacteria bacterium]|nr:hypothetical protein [Candidatus Delongbacteria bacterium]